jgi:hypothetical protein
MNSKKMKKQTLWLLFLGGIFMGFGLFAPYIIKISDSVTDFVKGMGVAFIIAGFFIEIRSRRNKE